MSADWFVDTNVLVYSRDSSEPAKQVRAEAWLSWLWRSRRGTLSVQVLQEYYATVTRKLASPTSPAEARRHVRSLLAWKPVQVDGRVLGLAWDLEDRFALSWWDSLIVGAAKAAGCKSLLTEDLQAAQDLDGVVVVDPFENDPPAQ